MATAEQLVFRPSDLIDRLLADAKTPHLLPVRAGEINRVRRQDFVRTHPEREERQILNFLNMDNGLLAFNDRSRKDSVYDNGASVQSLKFDDLRDGKGNRIALREALPVNDFIERCRTRCPADLPDRKGLGESALLKSIGFRGRDIRRQYLIRDGDGAGRGIVLSGTGLRQ